KLDIETAYNSSFFDNLSGAILYGNGAGSFTLDKVAPGFSSTTAVAAGDLNNDGRPDLLYLKGDSLMIDLSVPGSFLAPQVIPVGPNATSITLADLNGDGKLDILVPVVDGASAPNQPKLWIGMGNGAGGVSSSQAITVVSPPYGVAVGDLNGD